MKHFQKIVSDILSRTKTIEEYCDVNLVSEDGRRIMAHKVVLASASTILRKILQTYKEDEVITMKDVPSKFMNAMVDLI